MRGYVTRGRESNRLAPLAGRGRRAERAAGEGDSPRTELAETPPHPDRIFDAIASPASGATSGMSLPPGVTIDSAVWIPVFAGTTDRVACLNFSPPPPLPFPHPNRCS